MKEGFRQSMAWLHTWSGLLVGWVLFLVFCGGTSAYFKDEITFWMKPELHRAASRPVPEDVAAQRAVDFLQKNAADAQRWFISLPSEREPSIRMFWNPRPQPLPPGTEAPRRARFKSENIDPATGETFGAARETRGGEFLYRLHYDLHYMPAIWARWIVGFCAMFMLVAILSGIVTHKRIFKDFFTFRPKKGQRSWLDAHNATAVLALPYHLMITYTGIVTLMFMYMPWGTQAAYQGDVKAFNAEMFPASSARNEKPAGKPAALAALPPLMEQARAHWGEGARIGRVVVTNPNDAKAVITVSRQDGQDLSSDQPSMVFNGVTGALVATNGDTPGPAVQTRGVLFGLHVAHFSNGLMRALFFVSGLGGCVMVATGLLLWGVKERQKYAKALKHGGRVGFGLRLVDGLNVAAIAGLPIAFATYFWANRLLPVSIAERPQQEITCFFAAWAVAAVAGLAWPSRRMWLIQLWIGAVLFAAMPALNALTGGANLVVAIGSGLWEVAGFDLVCLGLGLALGFAAWHVGRRKAAAKTRPAPARSTGSAELEAAR
ncbi:PepSY-associated TM helix domain-containing protein [Xylophilus sp. GOD-11R]|uniref:PepSY-associated TM helix domain-containing protein n=1 Tax=Xylophilus sp. GOD-11R TaxID=3089814 RepID=UPI00298CF0D7|nr:PepSY-associated TM helix domain-containing protein [Xylophilus sp. GOD-11R]WPB55310.1 PepSY-associated TM helix domain-containing protein [Xylophilus sp. GOD-11R]